MLSHNQLLKVSRDASLAAGQFIQEQVKNIGRLRIEQKSLNDFVSEVDRGAESIIRDAISTAFPGHSILGEELGSSGQTDSEYQWIIDPLDGTTNFLRGIPHYAVSIALSYQGKLAVGVVYDPAKGELFSAIAGAGAQLNGVRISCSPRPDLHGALLATGVPFSGKLLENLGMFTQAMENLLAENTSGVRRLGAAALDLAYVAAGRYDGFWEASLKPWDIAAGALIVKEAGGSVSDFHGGDNFLDSGNIVAAGESMHEAMTKLVGQAYDNW